MTESMRAKVVELLPALRAERGRVTFHGQEEDDLIWAQRELGGHLSSHAVMLPGELVVEIREMVSLESGVLDLYSTPRRVAKTDPVLERVQAAFASGRDGLLWRRGFGDPPWT